MSIEQFLPKAIEALRPSEGAYYNSGNPILANKIVFDNKDISISQDDLDAKLVELQAEYDANQYQRDRAPDYPNLAEQFDLLWHAIDADTLDKTSDFYTTLKAVKDAHPKG